MTFLQHFGSIVKKVFHIGVDAAQAAAPFVAIAVPEVGGLFAAATGLAIALEGVSSTPGTGPAKFALGVASLVPQVEDVMTKAGVNLNKDQIDKFSSVILQAVVNALNDPALTAVVPFAAPAPGGVVIPNTPQQAIMPQAPAPIG